MMCGVGFGLPALCAPQHRRSPTIDERRAELPVPSGYSLLVALTLVFFGCATQAPYGKSPDAQPLPTPPDTSEAPARVGRINVIEGPVSFRPAAGNAWAPADLNRVVTTGDRLWADNSGQAEIEIGRDAVRMGHETELDITHSQ